MAYLAPHFDPDVFVSYSHGSPRGGGPAPLREWTQSLIRQLESEIFSLEAEFDPLEIWIDKQIDPTAHLTAELRAKVSASGVLMIVMSQRYLKSSWCKDELEWFRKQVEEHNSEGGRVFVIRAQQTDTSQWPDFLRDERGHTMPGFMFYDAKTGFPHGWPDFRHVSAEFRSEFCLLQTALIKRLRDMRARRARSAEATERPAVATATPSGPRRIYMHAPADTEPLRLDITKQLTGEGIVPLSPLGGEGHGVSDWHKAAANRMEMARHCEALALLRADDSARFTGDLLEIGIDERDRIATARGSPLPCAVFDKTGSDLPFDVSAWGIERFDVNRVGWKGEFKAWLDAARVQNVGAAA